MEKVKIINLRGLTKTLAIMPRTQCKGIEPQAVDADRFEARTMEGDQGGRYQAIVQSAYPRMVFQVLTADSPAQFDEYLGILLGIGETPVFIEGRTDHIVIFQGALDFVELTQDNYKQVARTISDTRRAAARWWNIQNPLI